MASNGLGLDIIYSISFSIQILQTLLSFGHMIHHLTHFYFEKAQAVVLIILFSPICIGWCVWIPVAYPDYNNLTNWLYIALVFMKALVISAFVEMMIMLLSTHRTVDGKLEVYSLRSHEVLTKHLKRKPLSYLCLKFYFDTNRKAQKFIRLCRTLTHQFPIIYVLAAVGTILSSYFGWHTSIDIQDLSPNKIWFWMTLIMVISAMCCHLFIYILASTIDKAITEEFTWQSKQMKRKQDNGFNFGFKSKAITIILAVIITGWQDFLISMFASWDLIGDITMVAPEFTTQIVLQMLTSIEMLILALLFTLIFSTQSFKKVPKQDNEGYRILIENVEYR